MNWPELKREWATAVMALLLAGCADDHYAVAPGAQRQSELAAAMPSNLRDCKRAGIHAYFEQRSNSGAIAGALLGGAVGGLVGSLADSAAGGLAPGGIGDLVQRCMQERGYEGWSRG